MALTSQISKYDGKWTNMLDVGSTTVPGLPAKPEFDLLVVIPDHGDEARVDRPMASLGYKPYDLLRAVASLCMPSSDGDPAHARRLVALLVDGFRYRTDGNSKSSR